MPFRCIIKFDGIQGTSELKNGFIDVLSYQWAIENNVKAWEKAPSGTATVKDFTIVKRVDPSSPDLFTNCVNGKKISTIEIVLVQAGGDRDPKEFAHYKFETCYITSVRLSGEPDGTDHQETVTFNFARSEYGYGAKKGGFEVGRQGINGQ
jgi:type VI secretion system secreted protein Hcp